MSRATAAFLTLLAASGWLVAEDRSEPAPPQPVAIGFETSLHSEVLDEERPILVSLPRGYERSSGGYPVIYLLDGQANFHHTTATVELLARSGRIPESIVIGIASTIRPRDFTAIAAGQGPPSGGAGRFLAFLETELIPHIEQNYRTLPHRTLVGHHTGGLLALHAMISHPDLFQAYIAISPAITPDEQEVAGEPPPLTQRAETFLQGRESFHRFLFMTMSASEAPPWLEDLGRLRGILEANSPDDLDWIFQEMADDDHATTVLRSTDLALRALYRGWNPAEIVASGGAKQLQEHCRQLDERLGYRVPVPEGAVNRMGYRLLGQGRVDEAVQVIELNLEYHPDAANVADSLGDALTGGGDLKAAVSSYERAYRTGKDAGDPSTLLYKANLERARQRLTVLSKPPPAGMKRGFVEIGNNEIYYEMTGEGPVLVLIHGGWIDRRMWDPQIEALSRDFQVLRYDVREHGLSTRNTPPYSNHDDLAELLTGLGIERAAVMGLSLGGFTAIDFALAHPDKITALIPVAPGMSGYEFSDPAMTNYGRDLNAAFGSQDYALAVEIFLRAWTDGPRRAPEDVDAGVRNQVRRMILDGLPPGGEGMQPLDPPAIGRLEEIDVPTLTIVGDIDMPDILTIVDLIEERVPGARKVILSGAAHMVNMEKPEEINRLVREFLLSTVEE
jgi:pimeloyl-ACP methyl ester carboxylesterase